VSARGQFQQLRDQLQATFDRFDTIPTSELETRSEYARHLLLRLAGFLEYALEQAGSEFIDGNAGGPVRSFAHSFASYTGNLDSERLCQYVGRFDHQWRVELEEFLGHEERRNSINSLNGLRNAVAHGKPSSVSMVNVIGYLGVVDEFFAFLLDRLEPI
jgi:hypothetical protein